MNDHGWGQPIGTITAGGLTAYAAPRVPERDRCVCRRDWCARKATAEDFLCDQCREHCYGPWEGST